MSEYGGTVRRFSSRRRPLDRSFLCDRLREARGYDRIAGYFCSSLLEVVGEELESVEGAVRMVCNSALNPADVEDAVQAIGKQLVDVVLNRVAVFSPC
jgi:hypothetical protein